MKGCGALGTQLKRLEVRAAIQVSTGFFILLAALSHPTVWRALSLPQALISPVYAIVSFSIVMQAFVGTSLSYVVQRFAAAVVSGAVALACIAITLAANGGTYAPSTTKAAVMTVCSTFCGFILAMGAYRFQSRYWFGWIVASLMLPIASLSAFHLDYVEWLTVPYFLIQVAIGVTMGALVSMLVLPNTAARAVMAGTAAAMRGLGAGTAVAVDILLADPPADSDSPAAASRAGKRPDGSDSSAAASRAVKRPAGSAASLAHLNSAAVTHEVSPESIDEFVERWAAPASAALVKAKESLIPVATEVSLYRRPRIFPREAYATLLGLLRHYLSTLMTLTYLAEGDAPLRAARALRGRAVDVAAAVDAALTAAAAVIAGEPGASYLAALKHLDALEEQLQAASTQLVRDLVPPGEAPYSEGELVMADTVIAVLFSLGSRVRRLFFVLPDTLAGAAAAAAWTAWREHFSGKGKHWDFEMGTDNTTPGTPHALQTPAVEARSPLAAQQLARLASLPASPHALSSSSPRRASSGTARLRRALSAVPATPKIALSAAAAFPPPVTAAAAAAFPPPVTAAAAAAAAFPPPVTAAAAAPAAPDESSPRAARSVFSSLKSSFQSARARWAALPPLADATLPWGITGEALALSLQVWVSLVGATVLHVCGTTYDALNQTTIWIPVTVAVMAQKSVGGVALRGANRLVGTAGAGVSGLAILYLVYAINGASYANTPAKFISMTFIMSAVSGALMFASLRAPHQYAYAFTVWKFTLVIVALAGYASETLSARTALFRLANIAIGLALDFVATISVFPVSTQGAVVRRVRRVLNDLAGIAAGSSDKLLHSGSATTSPAASPGAGVGLRRPSPGAVHTQNSSPERSPGAAARQATDGNGLDGATEGFSFTRPSLDTQRSANVSSSLDVAAPGITFDDASPAAAAAAGPAGVPQVARPAPLPPLNLHIRTSFTSRPLSASASPPKAPAVHTDSGTPDATPFSAFAAVSAFSAFSAVSASPRPVTITTYVPREESATEAGVMASLERSLSAPLSPTTPGSSGTWYAASPPKAAPARAFRHQRTKWVSQVVLGRARTLLPLGQGAATLLEAMAELEMITAFENKAFKLLGRRRGAAGGAGDPAALRDARRTLRRMLNALLSFAYVLDGPDDPHLRLLLPFRPDIDALMAQLSECLRAVAGAAAGTLPLDRIEATQANLRAEAVALVSEVEGAPLPPGSTKADVVMGFAALGVLVATIQTLAETTEAVLALCLPQDLLFDPEEGDLGDLIHSEGAVAAGDFFQGPEGPQEAESSSEDLMGAGRRGTQSLPRGRGSQGGLVPSASMASVRAMRLSTSAQVLLGGRTHILGEPSMVDLVSAGRHRGAGGGSDDEDVEAARALTKRGD